VIALLRLLGPLAAALGLNLTDLARKYPRDVLLDLLNEEIAGVVKRLEADKITPALKATSADGERLFIRASLYLLLKGLFSRVLPHGANVAADLVRDQIDDRIVRKVRPEIDSGTSTRAAVLIVANEIVETLL
jgi:hypothetical protein